MRRGQAVAAGVYLYRLTAGGQHYTRRMVLVDGQAGVAAVAGPSAGRSPEATERAYGIAVVGVGLAAYVECGFSRRAWDGPGRSGRRTGSTTSAGEGGA